MRRTIPLLAFVVGMAGVTAPAIAQTTNPCTVPIATVTVQAGTIPTVAFTSDDHMAMLADGVTPKVASYTLGYYLQGATAPIQTGSIPRASVTPVAGTTPLCYTTAAPNFGAVPLGGTFLAKVVAVGSPGVPDSAESAASNPFVLPATAVKVPSSLRISVAK